MFKGFAVFTRHNPVWNVVGDDWGFEVTPWVMIGVVLLLFLGWLLYDYRKQDELDLRFTPLAKVDLGGIAGEEDEDDKPGRGLKTYGLWILNKI